MDDIDVLCINCENMISLDKITAHSSVCIAPTNYILKLSSADPLKLINFRLDKLKCAMESILHEELKHITTDEKMIFLYLSRQSAEIISIHNASSETIDSCSQIAKQIGEYPSDFLSPCVSLYLERVRVIANQKSEALKDDLKFKESGMTINSVIECRTSQIEGLRKQIQKLRQANGGRDVKGEYLDVCSVIDDTQKSSIGSSLASPRDEKEKNELEELDSMFSEQEVELSQKSNEDLQRYFYSKCLMIKLGFPSRDPVQLIQIPDLYKKVRETAIPVASWDEFIMEEFSKLSSGSKAMERSKIASNNYKNN